MRLNRPATVKRCTPLLARWGNPIPTPTAVPTRPTVKATPARRRRSPCWSAPYVTAVSAATTASRRSCQAGDPSSPTTIISPAPTATVAARLLAAPRVARDPWSHAGGGLCPRSRLAWSSTIWGGHLPQGWRSHRRSPQAFADSRSWLGHRPSLAAHDAHGSCDRPRGIGPDPRRPIVAGRAWQQRFDSSVSNHPQVADLWP